MRDICRNILLCWTFAELTGSLVHPVHAATRGELLEQLARALRRASSPEEMEAINELFILWSENGTLETECTEAFLKTSMRNNRINAIKRNSRLVLTETIGELAEIAPDMEAKMALSEEAASLIRVLPKNQGKALRMRASGYSYKEIALAVDAAPATVRQWFSRDIPRKSLEVLTVATKAKTIETALSSVTTVIDGHKLSTITEISTEVEGMLAHRKEFKAMTEVAVHSIKLERIYESIRCFVLLLFMGAMGIKRTSRQT